MGRKLKFFRLWRVKLIAGLVFTVVTLRVTGLYMYFFQENYFSEFAFKTPNISVSVAQLAANQRPVLAPIYSFDHGYRLQTTRKCSNVTRKVDLLYLVKSAVSNADNRMSIRSTWGLEHRFNDLGYVVQLVFLLALPLDGSKYSQKDVETEQNSFGDIVQGDFIDEYYNNTYKTVMGFRWAKNNCPEADFVMFVDDDFYISTKNVLRLISREPESYPMLGLQRKSTVVQSVDHVWYTGHLFFILPVRFYFNKFYVSLDEYPYNVFPPFINAGAFLLTRHTLIRFHYAAMYTRMIKLDDVYVGILAKRLGVVPTHNRHFYPFRVPSSASTYRNLIASHGFRDHNDLIRVWNQQFQHGNA